ncbi:MAG: hypothetical protein CL477_05320 [Acidobacteria bacterium]|jgi:acyl-CoA thioesterase|nr:hypothetical protein [Acidobacteriota bacterium]MDP7691507.1 PaaI family thioesterase [Vicinamibacterales bacterium]HJN43373.1 PaaI family thioesterase [Vicinamibacterales bacterium]|tara:strand:+ start:2091 stop:2558 length:468 start_codon:yes stop_codon:yes gene_type:complete
MTDQDEPTFREILLEKAGRFPFFKLIGLEILDAAPGRSTSQVTWRPDLTQPAGLLHGGVIATLIDTGIAYSMLLCDELHELLDGGGSLVSVDLRVKYLRPVSKGTVICESRVVRMGRRVIHADAVVTDDQGKEVARGDSIYTPVTPEQIRGARAP